MAERRANSVFPRGAAGRGTLWLPALCAVSCGALAVLASPWLGRSVVETFLAAFLLSFAAFTLWSVPHRQARRDLAFWRRLRDEGLITQEQHDWLRGQTLGWYLEWLEEDGRA
jgi:hypothetical protein